MPPALSTERHPRNWGGAQRIKGPGKSISRGYSAVAAGNCGGRNNNSAAEFEVLRTRKKGKSKGNFLEIDRPAWSAGIRKEERARDWVTRMKFTRRLRKNSHTWRFNWGNSPNREEEVWAAEKKGRVSRDSNAHGGRKKNSCLDAVQGGAQNKKTTDLHPWVTNTKRPGTNSPREGGREFRGKSWGRAQVAGGNWVCGALRTVGLNESPKKLIEKTTAPTGEKLRKADRSRPHLFGRYSLGTRRRSEET